MGLEHVSNLVVLGTFYGLLIVSLVARSSRHRMLSRSRREWWVDILSLVSQGILIPLLQIILVVKGLEYLLPQQEGSLSVSPFIAFLLSFVFVDYLYYWNHRFLHLPKFWRFHRLHHSTRDMDVLVTSRNSLLTPFLIVYLWVHGLFLFLIADDTFYVLGVALSSALDLIRHTSFPKLSGYFHRYLSWLLISPIDHGWHHTRSGQHWNYGANFSLWDRIHGTLKQRDIPSKSYGIPVELSMRNFLLFPIQNKGATNGRS